MLSAIPTFIPNLLDPGHAIRRPRASFLIQNDMARIAAKTNPNASRG
jgi:hypothetical protein